jgi:Raf kinase inhibitor-like YbhB/YbcL family protein
MNRRSVFVFSLIILTILLLGIGYFLFFQRSKKEIILEPKLKQNMIISSFAFQNNGYIPSKYSCDGENINPPLEVQDVPPEAKSLVLIVDDPDVPGGTWVHWTVWNIDPKTSQISEHSVPSQATEGKTSFGKPGYGGPCPPSGTHRYFFKLYALDTMLSLDSSATKQDLERSMQNHVLLQSELIGLYQRQQYL